VSKAQIGDAFAPERGWDVISIEPERVMTRYHDENGAPAWLATIKRRSAP
jgi:hypothetical protein